ncbi:MAG: hypothetical protein K8T90_01905 [Planctomycetes bacterium]|nr:hypothetical protein [Planctomycetota bacterium]
MQIRRRLLAFVLAGPMFCMGCETTELFNGDPDAVTPPEAVWQETETFAVPSVDLLWERAIATMESDGYDVDTSRTKYADRKIVSNWVTHLGTARFQGIRRRAHITLVPTGRQWAVRVAVIKQWNADIDDPMNPAEAQWEKTELDVSRTARLLYGIRAGFELDGNSDAPK